MVRVREHGLPLIGDLDVHYNKNDISSAVGAVADVITKVLGIVPGRFGNVKDLYAAAIMDSPLKRGMTGLSSRLVAEWDHDKNIEKIDGVSAHSNKKFWWRCKQGHQWQATASDRSRGNGCPYCYGRNATREKSLAATHPEIALEWHEDNQGSAFDVGAGSSRRAIWRCRHGYVWEQPIRNRIKYLSKCPHCSGRGG